MISPGDTGDNDSLTVKRVQIPKELLLLNLESIRNVIGQEKTLRQRCPLAVVHGTILIHVR